MGFASSPSLPVASDVDARACSARLSEIRREYVSRRSSGGSRIKQLVVVPSLDVWLPGPNSEIGEAIV